MTDGPPLPRSAELFRGFEYPPDEAIPPPPYQVNDVRMNFIGVRFRPSQTRALLPQELEPVDEHTGTICVYTAGYGWGIAPFSACFAAIEVKGFDSPDGSPGYYMAAGYFSGRAGVVMRRDYNLNFLQGSGRHEWWGDVAASLGGPDGGDAVTMRMRPSLARPAATSGIHHYLGRNAEGGTNLYAVAFAGELWPAEPLSVVISDVADPRMVLAQPVELLWAFDCRAMSLTFSAPKSITDDPAEIAEQSVRASLLSVFTRLGQAAVLVGPLAEIRLMNPSAEDLLTEGVLLRHGRLTFAHRQGQGPLDLAISTAIARGSQQFDLHPIMIEAPDGRPLIVQAVPIEATIAGGPSAVVLFSDPRKKSGNDPVPSLLLLGLTPAEARIASLIGRGLSPREASGELEVSEGTVRTSLSRIYEKLDINRQSELARIVAKLENIGR